MEAATITRPEPLLSSLYLRSTSDAPPLRIGLLLDGTRLPACFAEVVDQIAQSGFARLELLVFNANVAEQPRPLLKKTYETFRDKRRRQGLLFTLYSKWDSRNVPVNLDPLSPVDCTERFRNIDSISVKPITKRFVHRFPDDALESIREKHLDVLIRFGFNILRGGILTTARYGVWSYHHGDNDYYRGGPSYFWEMYEGNPLSGAILQVLTEELDAGKVLCKGLFATQQSYSHGLNRIQPYWGASTFLIRKLRELHQHGWERLEQSAVKSGPYLGRKKIYTTPSNIESIRWLAPLIIRGSARRLKHRWLIQHWRLAIRTGARPVPDFEAAPDLSGFQWIESPKDRFYADPFAVRVDGRDWLFFEDFDYGASRARISCAEIRSGGIGEPVTALEAPYHLSYPCVFWDRGELWMIPESEANGNIELYRCVRFPHQWEKIRELFNGPAVDTTVWIEDNSYWFFTTLHESRGGGSELWLFHADSLTGDWVPHPDNPISTDVRSNRGGGAIFRHSGKLLRPSQDCSRNYGFSVTFNEILALDECRYRERPGVSILPTWTRGLIATHTYCRAGECEAEIVDGRADVRVKRVLEA